VVSSALCYIAAFESLVVDARRYVELTFAVLLVVQIVEGIEVEVVIDAMAVVKHADVPFVLKRVFLLSMLWVMLV
jgi:hypothetical protein